MGQSFAEHLDVGTGDRRGAHSMPLRWVPILGGTCRFGDSARLRVVGDLLVAVTPLTYRHLDRAGETDDVDLPITGVGHADACRLAALVGGRLPTSVEWEWLAGGLRRRPYPWGEQPWAPHLARLRGPAVEYEGPGPVGRYLAGATPQGLLDVAGNVWEWTASRVMGGGYVICGGGGVLRLQAAVWALHLPQRRPRRTAQPRHRRTPREVSMSSTSSRPLLPAEDHPVLSRMVIVGCTARKASALELLPALELYNGGCVPPLRARLGDDPRLRARVRFLSAEHGLVTADTPLRTYDRPLDSDRAGELRPAVMAVLHREMSTDGVPREVLVVAEPLYLVLLADLLALPARPRVHWIPDPAHGWAQARAVLDQWGW